MTPFFNPGPNPHGNPQILLAAVGPLMTGERVQSPGSDEAARSCQPAIGDLRLRR
jgi:hypothetical protein